MRTCIIFDPTARGDKANRFRRHLDEIGAQSTLKLTSAPGDASRLAGEAVREGFEIIAAAGGDGTVNEVLNGLAAEPGGLEQSRLAVLPLGTVNVFARELAIPSRLEAAWEVLKAGQETRIDLPQVEFRQQGKAARRFFAQLAGAGLDARAIELVHYPLKKKIGPFAYVAAGLRALAGIPSEITVTNGKHSATGGLVLIGNGRLYGGKYRIFPRADLRDGLLEVCVFPRANWMTLARCGPRLVINGVLPESAVKMFQGERLELSSALPERVEVDGELLGYLPATFTVVRSGLKVIAPACH